MSVASTPTSSVVREPGSPAGRDIVSEILPLLPALRGYLRRRVAASDVDDVIQDVFVRLARREAADAIETPKRYLFQVAKAALIDRHRRDTSRCAEQHCELSDVNHPTDELSPLRVLQAREDMRIAREVIAAMPARRREILVALRLEGASLKAVAARYGISTSAVEKHLTRALQGLAERLPAAERSAGPQRRANTRSTDPLAVAE